MPNRYVVLGDVVQSRDIDDRNEFQDRLRTACDHVNQQFDRDIYARFQMLKGVDEVGGVLASASNIYAIVKYLFDDLDPHRLRIAVVYDEVDVGIETRVVSEMDGPAFHQADGLLDSIEQTGLLFDMQTGRKHLDLAVADEINLLLAMRQQWTDRQREVVNQYEQYENQYEVADELGISQQAVSKTLSKASWPLIEHVEKRLEQILQEYGE